MANDALGDRFAKFLLATMAAVLIEQLLVGDPAIHVWRLAAALSAGLACSVIALTTHESWLSADHHGGEEWVAVASGVLVLSMGLLVSWATISKLDVVVVLVVVPSVWLTATTLRRQSVRGGVSWGQVGVGIALITVGIMAAAVATRVVTLGASLPTSVLGLGCITLAVALVCGGTAVIRDAAHAWARSLALAGGGFLLCGMGLWSSGLAGTPLDAMVGGFGAAIAARGIGELNDVDALKTAAAAAMALVLALGAVAVMGVLGPLLAIATTLVALSASAVTMARVLRRRGGMSRRADLLLMTAGVAVALASCISGLGYLSQQHPLQWSPAEWCTTRAGERALPC